MRIIIILVIFVRYYKNKERMRRRNRMQKPVNIGGTGRERKAGNRNWKKHAGREAERGDSAGKRRTGETYDEAKRHIAIGRTGEEAALEYLLQNGYKLLERNWHCRHKEIDLIVENEEGIHIVEVKTRTGPTDIDPERAVDYRKQRNLEAAAETYLRVRKLQKDIHFNIIADAFFPIKNERQSITI